VAINIGALVFCFSLFRFFSFFRIFQELKRQFRRTKSSHANLTTRPKELTKKWVRYDRITHTGRGNYEKSNLHPQLDISSCKLYLYITLNHMGSKAPKTAHKSQKKKKKFFKVSKIFKKYVQMNTSPQHQNFILFSLWELMCQKATHKLYNWKTL